MEDWGSPWADDEKLGGKDEKPKSQLPSKVKDVKAEEEEEGSDLEKEEGVTVTPVAEEKQDAAAAGLTVDWDGGFVDSSAWANATPRVQIEDGDSFGWGTLRSGGFAGVRAKGGGDSEEGEEGRIEDDWRDNDKDDGVKTTNLHPIATDEVNAWGAGSDWGDPRTPRTPESRIGRMNDALGLSLDEVGDNTSNGGFGARVKDSPTPDVDRHDRLIDAETLLNSPTKQLLSGGGARNLEESSGGHLQAVLEAVSGPAPPKTQEDPKDASTPESHSATPPEIYEANSPKDDCADINTSDPGDGDDDFGDFAVEGGEFEEPQAFISEPVLPPVINAPPPDSFEIDVSLVSKLYPIPTSRPDPPPIGEIISTTESRKTWYRLSTSGTIRRNRSDDDDYVRVMWAGSEVQARVNKIVERWISEDRNSGGGRLISGGKRVSAMFGWGDSNSKISDQRPISLEGTPQQLSSRGRSRKASRSRPASISTQSPPPKPAPAGISSSSESVGGGSVSSPQAASFRWGSTRPQSSPSSVEIKEKTPSTPLRTNFHSPTRHSSSSQLTPQQRPAAPHSPTTDTTSAGSMIAASITQSPTHSPTTDAKDSPIAPAPEFPRAADNPIPVDPLPAGLSANTQATALASASGLDDWGALGNMSADAPPTSTNSQSRNCDGWGAFEDLAMPGSSTSAPKEIAPIIGSRDPPAATKLNSTVPAPRPSAQSSTESNKGLNSAQTALGPADTTNGGWGDLGPLSSQPPKSQTLSSVSSSHVPQNQKINSLTWSRSKDQKTSQPNPVECSPEGSRLSIPSTTNMSGGESSIPAPLAGSAFDDIKGGPVVSNVQTQQDSDEGDDWGEMVQSPLMPTGALGFPEALGMPAPTSSQDITSLSASIPPTPPIPQRMPAPGLAPALLSAPAPVVQPTPAPSATLTLGDLGQKSSSSIGDSWDLSIFEGPPTPKTGFSVPGGISEPAIQDLWDTPAVAQTKASESANDKTVREIVEGLPDLRYMLG